VLNNNSGDGPIDKSILCALSVSNLFIGFGPLRKFRARSSDISFNVTVSMNCWSFGFMGSLWRSLTIQWWGVGTLQDQLKRFGVDT
jgi:hypothetical protein